MNLISIDIYRDLMEKQLLRITSKQKELFFLLAEEKSQVKLCNKYTDQATTNEDKTTVLLGYMERITWLRNVIKNYQPSFI